MTGLQAAEALSASQYAGVRRRVIFDCCKWDPQVGDTPSLCDFPLILNQNLWLQLARTAESLEKETLAAEAELVRRPELHHQLGLPRPIRSALKHPSATQGSEGPRVMRFDFHATGDGWRISEVNSDVPGGFIESSAFTQLVAEHYPGTRPAPDPADAYVQTLKKFSDGHRSVGLVHATSYVDDRQVMIYLARRLAECSIATILLSPADLVWNSGLASVPNCDGETQLGTLVRFFPAEWLPNLDRRTGWTHFFHGSQTPLSNPATAILTQSKRLPLVWDQLTTPLTNWRDYLPETRDPRHVPWRSDDGWVLKPALGRVGDSIGIRGVTSAKDWRMINRSAKWCPSHWVAQRRFEALPILHAGQPYYPVLGVYVIEGQACGIYGRVARRPLIDHQAQDIAVLIETD